MVDYIEAIKRPFSDIKKSGLAALLVWIPIINFLTYGYFLDCAKLSLSKKRELPEWSNLGDKFVKGLLFIAIKILYGIPLIIIIIVMMMNFVGEMFQENFLSVISSRDPNAIITIINSLFLDPNVVGILIAAIIIGILISYVIPMASIMYVVNWKFKDAFDFKTVFKKVMTKEYFSAWIVVAVYSVLLMSVGSLIPLVGGLIATTLIGITSYTIYGEVYKEIRV